MRKYEKIKENKFMITNFQIFEKNNNLIVNINLPENLLNKIIDNFSFLIYKGKKRDGNINYKSLRINSLDGQYDNSQINLDGSSHEFILKIEMSNKDKIDAKYSTSTTLKDLTQNNIYISINDKVVFDFSNEKYDETKFIDKITEMYIKYIEKKNWKIK